VIRHSQTTPGSRRESRAYPVNSTPNNHRPSHEFSIASIYFLNSHDRI